MSRPCLSAGTGYYSGKIITRKEESYFSKFYAVVIQKRQVQVSCECFVCATDDFGVREPEFCSNISCPVSVVTNQVTEQTCTSKIII